MISSRFLRECLCYSTVIKEKIAAMLEKKKLLGDGQTDQGKFVLKTAKGTRDYGPKSMAVRESVLKIVTDAFKRHGAETIDTPVFELREVLMGKYGEEGGKLVYDLQDQGGELLSLRYDLTLNHRFILEGMFAACGAGADQFKTVCSSVDKLDKQPWIEIEEELIKEKGLTKENTEKLGQFVRLREFNPSMGNVELLDKLMEFEELAKNARLKKGVEELKVKALEGINLETNGEEQKGLPVGVGSVAAGGRYDELVGNFMAPSGAKGKDKRQDVPCVGISFGIERLFAIMEAKMQIEQLPVRTTETEIFIASAQKNLLQERMKLCKTLWDEGFKVEFAYKANPKLLTQLQYCEDRLIPLVLIVGERELQEGVVKLRNVKARAEQDVPFSELVPTLRSTLASL
ncbi:anticodon binding domain protein [Teladorsagia circumcincta]|uniref:histidine--tRNA ligase n=1 Tax=Teladorsagia circumcincta TaxID=45464 RepID=A0A2G9UQJ6_TELCI|nr:anticodon binding domain protein [Teladorsagia circumcincta]